MLHTQLATFATATRRSLESSIIWKYLYISSKPGHYSGCAEATDHPMCARKKISEIYSVSFFTLKFNVTYLITKKNCSLGGGDQQKARKKLIRRQKQAFITLSRCELCANQNYIILDVRIRDLAHTRFLGHCSLRLPLERYNSTKYSIQNINRELYVT